MNPKARRHREEREHRERMKHDAYVRRMIELEEEEEIAYRERLYYEDYLYRTRMYEYEMAHGMYYDEEFVDQERAFFGRYHDEEFADQERMLPRDIAHRGRRHEEDLHRRERTYGPEWADRYRWRRPDEREQMTEGQMLAESWNTYNEGARAEPGIEGNGGYLEMLTEDGREIKYTDEEKAVFKMKHSAYIPYCYFGTFFDKRFNEFTVQVYPVSHSDLTSPGFLDIKSRAVSFKISLNPKADASSEDNTLEILVNSENVRYLLAGIMKLKYSQSHVNVKLTQRQAEGKAAHKMAETEELPVLSSIVNRVSFRLNSTQFQNHQCNKDNSSENLSALYLRNLPKSVYTTFLRILFPLCQKSQLAVGESGSAVVQMCCAKMALFHMASITCLQINNQAIQMKTEVPPHVAVQMLRESADNTSKQSESAVVPKKKKKLSPSDIRRNLRKMEDHRQRMTGINKLPPAPPFPGVPSLLSMSFPGPGNTPAYGSAQKTHPSSGPSAAFSGQGYSGAAANRSFGAAANRSFGAAANRSFGAAANRSFGAAKKASGADSMLIATAPDDEFPIIPIPQLLEGPYPDPNYDDDMEGSKKIRTKCYFRRRASRVAVHYAHMWGEDLQAISKALANSAAHREAIVAPPSKFSAKPLSEKILLALRKKTKEKPSLDEMQKAEDHWQKKRKEREAAGKFVPVEMPEEEMNLSKKKSESQLQRDRDRMTAYNKNISGMREATGAANTNSSGNNRTPVPGKANNPNSLQKSGGASSQTGGWPTTRSGWNTAPAQQQFAYPPAPSPTPPPPSPGSYQQGQYQQGQYQQGQDQQGHYQQGQYQQGQYQQGHYQQGQYQQGQDQQGQYQQAQDHTWQQPSQQSTFRYPPPPPQKPARPNQNRGPQPPAPRSAQPHKSRFPSPSPSPPPAPNRKRFFGSTEPRPAQPSQNRYNNPPSDPVQNQFSRPPAPAHKAQNDFKFTRPPPPGPIQPPQGQNQSSRFQQPNSSQASYPTAPTPPPPNQYSFPPPPSPSATPPPVQAQNQSSWHNTSDSSYWNQGYGWQGTNQQASAWGSESSETQQSDNSQSGWGSEYAGGAGYDQSGWGSHGNQQQY